MCFFLKTEYLHIPSNNGIIPLCKGVKIWIIKMSI